MSSGVAVNDTCLDSFQELKLRKKFKYIIFKLSDDNSEIVVERAVESASYEEFVSALPHDTCRWAVFDFDFEKPGEGQRTKICFISWSPDTAKIKLKMLYASSKDALRKKLIGVAAEIQATDLAEVSYDEVFDKVSRGN